MRKIYAFLILALFSLAGARPVWSQSSPNCATASDDDFLYGRAFFNFGSVTKSLNTKMRLNAT
ncbi:MAG: hypothetical protein RLZ62_2673, partial [Bacteroidota bacterium]